MKRLVIIALSLFVFSCEKYSEGLNVDPNNFTDAPGESIIGQANLTWVLITEGEASRMAGIFSDQYTGFSNQFINYNVYDVKSSDFDGIWNNNYAGGIAQTRIVQEKAIAAGNNRLLGVAQIVEAVMGADLAALFGDVPFSQSALPVDFPDPAFDDQLAVFEAAQNLLSLGIENVGNAKVSDLYGSPIFVENNATWAEVAHTLKARYYLITKNYAAARDEAKLGISGNQRSLLSFHSDISGQENLYYQFGIEQRGGYLTATRSHLRKLINLSDISVDRLLYTPGEEARTAHYFSGNELNYNEGGYFAKDASYPIVDWYENQLILAEAEYRLGNEEGAKAAFNAVRRELAVKYNADFPEISIGGNTLLRVILEEKYITMVGSPQVYSDLRRTNNLVGVPVKSSTAPNIPQRFLYPEVEINTNKSFPGVIGLYIPTKVNE
ncbi:SusD/RagB family nutrient-binding outer membrane lipoprotein [uncultured Arcticibacterium sp.]|uniref:SusD/RagB family nutrient-binding outer membrane lipoprotein n=1 Tax=uncultured Arcticibacterium sp. TaxID=2173042 RepID=UPI0030FD1536